MASSGSGTGSPVAVGTVTAPSLATRITEVPLLPIARYAEIMQISLPHFHQMQGAKAPMRSGCDEVWDQDARDLLTWTMVQAEELIANELGFWPAPKFITNEPISLGLNGVRGDWTNAELKTEWGYVQAYGTELLTLKHEGATVEYLDLDNDPNDREETAEIGNSIYEDLTSCSDPCDVAVFFRTGDGAEDAADPRYEIRPLKVDIDSTTMRIRGDSALFIRPNLWNLTRLDCIGSHDDLADENRWIYDFALTNLVSQVDVYCRTVSAETPVTLRWNGVCSCTSACDHETQTACAYPTDMKRGFFAVRPSNWNGTYNVDTCANYAWPPESVLVNYLAGYPLDPKTCRMSANFERAIVKLTNVLLPEPPCAYCDAAQVRWQNDRKVIDPLTPEAASMPWDLYAQGALEAWRIVKRFAMGRGGKMGR